MTKYIHKQFPAVNKYANYDFAFFPSDMSAHFGSERLTLWEQRHSLSDKITQAKTVLVRIEEVLTSSQESLDLHRRYEELLGRLESEINVVSVIIESEEFQETEEAVRARREKVEADNRDLQELIKKLAMLTSPAGKLTNTFFRDEVFSLLGLFSPSFT